MFRSFASVLWFGLSGSHIVDGFVVNTPKPLQAGSLFSSTSIAAENPSTSSSQQLRLSLLKPWSLEVQRALEKTLEENIFDTTFFLRAKCQSSQSGDSGETTSWQWQCEVPLFEADCRVGLTLEDLSELHPSLVLSLEGSEILSKNDFEWVCRKFYECADSLKDVGIDCEPLRAVVVGMLNQLPADPGVNAATAQWSREQKNSFENLLEGGKDSVGDLLKELDDKGFVVIDPQTTEDDEETCPLTTDSDTHEALSSYLAETTRQGETVRTDRVHFLSREQADACGVMQQYDLLMGIADYFNDQQDQPIPSSMYMQPVAPATTSKQLTIPRRMQFAEYALNDFYKAHSDNSLTGHLTESDDAVRRNFRAYTCILYLNDEWNVDKDGGALRLYPQSQKYHCPDEAVEDSGNNHGYVDISPNHGRLLIFDSRLVHSVEPVTTSKKVRRALTLWINRPNNCEVPGETFY